MMAQDPLPLDGIRVLELCGPVGSYGGRLLADAGADVVKVELPAGDELRRQGPFAGRRSDPEPSLTFAYYHANKRGIVLDYRSPDATRGAGRAGGAGRCGPADPAGGRLRSGLAPAVLGRRRMPWSARSRRSGSPARTGPGAPPTSRRARWPAPCTSTGRPKDRPWSCRAASMYDHVGTHAAIAVLAALRARPASGGQFIDISAHEVLGVQLVRAAQVHEFPGHHAPPCRLCRSGRHVALPGRPDRVLRLDR